MKNENSKGTIKLFSAVIFVYIVLFEFILPINKVLPKPSLLFDSIIHIWRDYSLLYGITATACIVFICLLLGYLSAYLKIASILRAFQKRPASIEMLGVFLYIPAVIVVAAFYFWFKEKLFAEILFALLSASFMIYSQIIKNSTKVKEEYILSARNLGLTQTEIFEKIYWYALQPLLFTKLRKVHMRLWSLVLLFEFVNNAYGLGHIIRLIVEYKDFTALFNLFVIISLLIWAGDSFICFLKRKYFFWEM